ncbi:MAG: hypothetical protein ACI4SH_04625, partial [Candidatus Scatosoma sp.]
MIRFKITKRLAIIGTVIALLLLAPFRILAPSGKKASAAEREGLKNVVTENSTGRVIWSAPGKTAAAYAYSENGGSLKLTKGNDVISACIVVTNDGIALGESELEFTTKLSATSEWEWNHVIFRGDSEMRNFTAFAFRKGGGHMTVLSRYDDKFYTFETSNVIYNVNTVKAYPLGQSDKLSALNNGAEVSLKIRSTETEMQVYMGGEVIFQSALAHKMAPATGVLTWSDASSNPNIELSGIKNYVSDYTVWNNAVNAQSIVYSPLGGGGAQSTAGANGSTLTPGSSKDGMAVFTAPQISGRVVQTYTFSMDTPASNIYDWYTVLIRADETLEDYIALRIRRAYGHVALFGKINGYNCSYASNEPFYERNVNVFPLSSVSGFRHVEEGTFVSLVLVSDREDLAVYVNNNLVVQLNYASLKLKEGSDHGLDVSKLPALIADLPAATGMLYGETGGYNGAAYTGINCFYEGEPQVDTVRNSFLADITYAGKSIDGFTPGSFEYDITISSADELNKDLLECVSAEGTTVSAPVWTVNGNTGFNEATVTL